MTDRPIIFSGPMVRALLDGRKTQTRRVLKPQPVWDNGALGIEDKAGRWIFCANTQRGFAEGLPRSRFKMPYAIGDRLWVREAWRVGAWHYHNAEVAIDYCDGPRKEWLGVDDPDMLHRLIDQSRAEAKKAGSPLRDSYYEYSWPPGDSPCRWRPSIHMPRWASRLTLIVTDVRVQRLQDISEADAAAEGVVPTWRDGLPVRHDGTGAVCCEAFRDLWNSLHGPNAWAANPWVAAISFDVRCGNIDEATR